MKKRIERLHVLESEVPEGIVGFREKLMKKRIESSLPPFVFGGVH